MKLEKQTVPFTFHYQFRLVMTMYRSKPMPVAKVARVTELYMLVGNPENAQVFSVIVGY